MAGDETGFEPDDITPDDITQAEAVRIVDAIEGGAQADDVDAAALADSILGMKGDN